MRSDAVRSHGYRQLGDATGGDLGVGIAAAMG